MINNKQNMTNKNLLPDNVNNAEEYLEYLHAIGHFEYVKELEEFKEKILNSLPTDEEMQLESENYALSKHPNPVMVNFRKYCSDDFMKGAKHAINKIQGGNK